MPSEVALIPITAALKALLVGEVSVTSLISTKPAGAGGGPAIYDEGSVHQSASFPYLTIGAGTQVPFHTMGGSSALKFGWNCTLQIKAIGQGQLQTSESAIQLVLSRVVGVCYHGRPLTVTGYGSAWCDEFVIQPTLITVLAGVTTREVPGILRVMVHDR
jgi:hypothetical protein